MSRNVARHRLQDFVTLGADLTIPIDVITQRFALLGTSGGGKTYAAGKLAEELIAAGAQVVIVDNVGNWWGLRLAADGKGPGIPIPVLGGDRGDVALEPSHGRLVAQAIAETRGSMIVDISDFTEREQLAFVADFATHLLRLKKKRPGPVLVFWEECHEIMPQTMTGKEQAKTLQAVERLAKRGRNYGVGTALLSQRPAAVNKHVLNMAETLLAFRTGGPQDRDVLAKWTKSKALAVDLGELPELPTGTCIVWSPHWLGRTQRVAIGKKWTFDSTKTPEFGKESRAGALSPVDLERFKSTMGAAIERARADDPAVLRQEVSDLKRNLSIAEAALSTAAKATPVKIETREVPMLKEADIKRLERSCLAADAMETRFREQLDQLGQTVFGLRSAIAAAAKHPIALPPAKPAPAPAVPAPNREMLADVKRRSPERPTRTADFIGGAGLTAAHARVLAAVAALIRAQANPVSELVAIAARYSPTSRHYENLRGALRAAGLIEYPRPGVIALTDAGQRRTADVVPATRAAIHDGARSLLEKSHQRLLEPLLAAWPGQLTAAELADQSGYSVTSRHFENLRGKLRALSLITYPSPGVARAADILFCCP